MEEHAVDFAKEYNAEYWSVSALSGFVNFENLHPSSNSLANDDSVLSASFLGENVDMLFVRTAALAFDQAVVREYEDVQNIGSVNKQQIGGTVISTTTLHCIAFIVQIELP